ncbi:MAG: flagellar filament capping protein FliD [Firmicutes bacterium]|nr:flagellar filament capping protein FliD [Bacillota bacterium]
MNMYNINGPNRIVGLASGLDVDAIVKSLMLTEQAKVDSITQKQTLLEWKIGSHKELNSLLADFTNKYFSALSPNTSIHTASAYNIKSVALSNSQSVSISASSDAVDGAYVINEITSLAKGASAESAFGISSNLNEKVLPSASLKDLNLATALLFEQGTDDEGNNIQFIEFDINGVNFKFCDSDSLQHVISAVNKSDAGVTMSYSSLSDKLSVKSKTLGADSALEINNISGNFFAQNASDSAFGLSTATKAGTNAVLKINSYDVSKASNSFTIDGITYNLLNETSLETTFTIYQDVDASFNKIKNFIDDYNNLIETVNGKLKEEKFRSFLPLTQAQKKEMTEKEIADWEQKAKSGMLSGDLKIRQLLSDVRNAFLNTVDGAGVSFYEIGISTGYMSKDGKLNIDEAKLKNALANNPEGVANLFAKTSSAIDTAQKYNESGLAWRIGDTLKNYTGFIKSYTLVYSEKQLSDYGRKVTDFIKRMNEKEARYYKQYAALEKALSNLNAQSLYFDSVFNSGE